jgi:hypothetical protein
MRTGSSTVMYRAGMKANRRSHSVQRAKRASDGCGVNSKGLFKMR